MARSGDDDQAKAEAAPSTGSYRVLRGVNYPTGGGHEARAEPGDTVTDLPEDAIGWLLDDGVIEPA